MLTSTSWIQFGRLKKRRSRAASGIRLLTAGGPSWIGTSFSGLDPQMNQQNMDPREVEDVLHGLRGHPAEPGANVHAPACYEDLPEQSRREL